MACSDCGEDVPLKPRSQGKSYPWCAECHRQRQARYRATYLSDPEKRERNSRASRLYAEENPELVRQRQHAAFLELKREMLAAYGPNCRCCGEHREMFLTLEHVNRDGSAHRKRVGGGTNTYRDLRRRGWPQEGYTVLCMNCNWATRFGGVCPHQQEAQVCSSPQTSCSATP